MATIGFVEPIDPAELDRSGRRHGDPRTGSDRDQRTEPQRDRDRLLYASSLRRLGGVTQVALANEEGRALHNRFAHSIKVAQIGRRLAEKMLLELVGDRAGRDAVAAAGGLDPDVVESAGLAHDLGHPPFGHIGEMELECLMQEHARGDPDNTTDGFEGNAQSFRVVTSLARMKGRHGGLDLTRATLAAILKYPRLRPAATSMPSARCDPPPKFGAYVEDKEDFDFARARLRAAGLADGRPTIEAQLMDWADDITYAVHDLDDFFRAGWVPLERLRPLFPRSVEALATWTPTPEVADLFDAIKAGWHSEDGPPPTDEDLGRATIVLSFFPFERPFRGTDADRAALRHWSSQRIGSLVQGTQFTDRLGRTWLLEVAVLKALTRVYVHHDARLSTHQEGQRTIIRELFETYQRNLDRKNFDIFPMWARELAAGKGGRGQPTQARIIVDVIARFSDLQAVRIHHRLTGVDLGPLDEPSLV